jgi:hypothetical protein
MLSLASAACTPLRSASGTAFSVSEVIYGQRELIGRRIVIRGVLSQCHRRSCVLRGEDASGRERFLSIGASDAFDSVARRYAGRTVEIVARLTDVCLASPDPDIIAACADRASTLVDPVFIRAY